MNTILTIAGYDPSSGAGITRDLDVFFSLGNHGVSVPTATVLQGPNGVKSVYPTPTDQFHAMLDLVAEEIPVHAVKIGVVWDAPYCEEIARFLRLQREIPVVVDPVGAAKNATPLITAKGMGMLIRRLFPLANAVTPNIPEAAAITGKEIYNVDDMKDAAKIIHGMGPKAVIIKGGHLNGEPADVLFDGESCTVFEKRRVEREVHGTGCIFSSLIVSMMVRGCSPTEACSLTEEFMADMIDTSYRITNSGYYYSSSGIINSGGKNRWGSQERMET